MSTKFFTKKLLGSIPIFLVCFLLLSGLILSTVQSIGKAKSFYFLVSTEANVEVGTEFSRLDGGAGYLLEYNGQEYVAWSVYEKEDAARAIQNTLQGKEKSCTLVKVGGEELYASTDRRFINGLKLLESYIDVLDQCIAKLEKGMTQENCKRTLEILKKQLAYAQKSNKVTKACSIILERTREALLQVTEKQIFAKDLRYILCRLVDDYVQLSRRGE